MIDTPFMKIDFYIGGISCKQLPIKGRTLCPLLLLTPGILSAFNLWRSACAVTVFMSLYVYQSCIWRTQFRDGKQYEGSLKKTENWSCYSTFGHISKHSISYYRDTWSSMFIAALLLIARNWKQSRCPSTDEGIMKMWYIHTIELWNYQVNGWS